MNAPNVALQVPSLEALTEGLRAALARQGFPARQAVVVDRQPNIYASTFPTEIIACRLDDGEEVRLLCKYEAGRRNDSFGHRGRVRYEAEVYDTVLRIEDVSIPLFYGSYVEPESGERWLFLEYVENSLRLGKANTPRQPAMKLAARWAGEFHRLQEDKLTGEQFSFLRRYDADYYAGWSRRTLQYVTETSNTSEPWIRPLCRAFEEAIPELLSAPQTIIHGEYYTHNILFKNGSIYPVDWESAAIGPGEIDVVSLTDHWSDEIVRQCEEEYAVARWPEGAPEHHERLLDLSRLYLQFRWLGDRSQWIKDPGLAWRFDLLAAAGRRLGFL